MKPFRHSVGNMNSLPVLNQAVGHKGPVKSLRVSGQKGLEPIVYFVLHHAVSMVTTAFCSGHAFCHTVEARMHAASSDQ